MAEAGPLADAESLAAARQALERGEYGRVLRLLEPLEAGHPVTTPLGGELRMLMATALFGQGQGERALALCRSLRACGDSQLRSQARDLALVLEAPSLRRPREWSLTLPAMGEAAPIAGRLESLASRRRQLAAAAAAEDDDPPPPVGPTRAPFGFALLVLAVLLVLLTLLAGCVRLDTAVEFVAPGQLRLSQEVLSVTGHRLPWQQQLERRLSGMPLRPVAAARGRQEEAGPGQLFEAPVLPAAEAAALLQRLAVEGAALAGLELPPPRFSLQERNWLVGVHQTGELQIDLRALEGVPGLQLGVRLAPLALRAVRTASPRPVAEQGAAVRWPLEPGQRNSLRFACWRWSRLGLGAVAILALLVLVLVLQRLRLLAGFGWPALPS